jgi:hypothetical protein
MEGIGLWEVLGFGVGVVALILGVIHLHEIRTQAKQLREQAADIRSQAELSESHAKMLDAILRTQSTRHIGQFPDYIARIAQFIGEAKKEVAILCDFPAYGSFSAHHDFLKYRQAIETKVDEGLRVKITCLDSSSRVSLVHQQFSAEERIWEEWRQAPQNRDRLKTFIQAHAGEISADSISAEQFAALIEEEDSRTLKTYYAGAEIVQTKEHIPFYCWLVDGDSAIFAIPSFSEKSLEHGFSTLDPHLISGFEGIRSRYDSVVVTQESNPGSNR